MCSCCAPSLLGRHSHKSHVDFLVFTPEDFPFYPVWLLRWNRTETHYPKNIMCYWCYFKKGQLERFLIWFNSKSYANFAGHINTINALSRAFLKRFIDLLKVRSSFWSNQHASTFFQGFEYENNVVMELPKRIFFQHDAKYSLKSSFARQWVIWCEPKLSLCFAQRFSVCSSRIK